MDESPVGTQPDPRSPVDDPRFAAALKMIEHTGSSEFQIRPSDDAQPLVWVAVAGWNWDGHRPVAAHKGGKMRYECAAALDPLTAVFRLCAQVMDGGTCTHCGRPSGFSEDPDTLPLEGYVCWFAWDPELATFRRGCEGDAP